MGNHQFQTDHDPRTIQRGYWKYNALFAVAGPDERWDLSVIGENLADESTIAFIQDVPLFGGSFFVMKDRPRTFTLQGCVHERTREIGDAFGALRVRYEDWLSAKY